MIALISSDYVVKNHMMDILINFPQVVFFNSNDETIRNESCFNQFMKICKYAPEKKMEFSSLHQLKNYLNQLHNILN